jgi:hypothetical protein
MRKARLAQLILSLATTPDRAGTTVGDLLEQASGRSASWFWASIARTLCSHVWRDLSTSWSRMLGLGLWAWLASLIGGAAPLLILNFLWPELPITSSIGWTLTGGAALILSSMLAGWQSAALSKGREMAASVSIVFVFVCLYLFAEYASARQFSRIGKPWPGRDYAWAWDCIQILFIVTAAILFRFAHRRPDQAARV